MQLAKLWSGSSSSSLAGSRVLWALRRLGVGFAVVAVLKETSRAVFLALLPILYRFFPLSIRRLWQPPMHNLAKPAAPASGGGMRTRSAAAATAEADSTPQPAPPSTGPRLAELPHNAVGQPWDVDVTSRFFAYASIGVAVAGVTPRLLEKLGW